MRLLFTTILVAQFLIAQQENGYKISTTTQLVVVNVSAKDKSGNPIDGLKASDFTVTEDGKAQQLQVFEFQRLEDAALPPAELKSRDAGAKPATPSSA